MFHKISSGSSPKVAVVGAGIAGLTTAYRLMQAGIDVQLYEARGRIGGRIWTVLVDNCIAEMGGQNILDGGCAENLFKLIEECGLGLNCQERDRRLHYFDGINLSEVEIFPENNPKELKKRLEEIAARAKNMREVLDELFEIDSPLYHILDLSLTGYEGAELENLSPVYVRTLYQMLVGSESRMHQQASVLGGNGRLTEVLAAKLGNRLHRKKPLKAVLKASNGSYHLSFKNGEDAAADLLVLANPCSTYSDIIFDEGVVPQERLSAIQNIQYAPAAKIVLPLTSAVEDLGIFFGDYALTFFNTDGNLLYLYLIGEKSVFLPDQLQERYLQNKKLVEVGFGEKISKVAPICACEDAFAVYNCPVAHSWLCDPYAKGAFSSIAPGQDKLMCAIEEVEGEKVKSLFKPIEGSVYFAGEHTSILTDVPGTMEAACESGERAARMIINRIQTQLKIAQ